MKTLQLSNEERSLFKLLYDIGTQTDVNKAAAILNSHRPAGRKDAQYSASEISELYNHAQALLKALTDDKIDVSRLQEEINDIHALHIQVAKEPKASDDFDFMYLSGPRIAKGVCSALIHLFENDPDRDRTDIIISNDDINYLATLILDSGCVDETAVKPDFGQQPAGMTLADLKKRLEDEYVGKPINWHGAAGRIYNNINYCANNANVKKDIGLTTYWNGTELIVGACKITLLFIKFNIYKKIVKSIDVTLNAEYALPAVEETFMNGNRANASNVTLETLIKANSMYNC